MSGAGFIFRSMNAHQVLIILVVDTRVFGCVADSFQESRFTSISPTDYKDSKASIFLSKFIGTRVAHDRWRVKRDWCGNSASRFVTHYYSIIRWQLFAGKASAQYTNKFQYFFLFLPVSLIKQRFTGVIASLFWKQRLSDSAWWALQRTLLVESVAPGILS